MLARFRWFLIIVGVSLLVVFSLANRGNVAVWMPLLFSAELPLAMLLAVAALIGFMIGSLWTAWILRRPKPAQTSSAGRDPAATPAGQNPATAAPSAAPETNSE